MTQLRMARRVDNEERVIRKWLADAQRTGQKDAYQGRRQHPRYTWHTPVTLEICDADNEMLYATTRDISLGGLGLRTRRRLELHTEIRITVDATGESIRGRVRNCNETLGGFYVGVEYLVREASPTRTPVPVSLRRVA